MHRYLLCRYLPLIISMMLLTGAIRLYGQGASDTLRPGGIAGAIHEDESGLPVAHAIVSIDATTLSTSTARDGTFRFPGLPPGGYQLTVIAENHAPLHVEEIQVRAMGNTALKLVMKRRSVLTEDLIYSVDGHQQPIREAPASVSVVPAELIAGRHSRTLDRMLEYLPGVEMNGAQVNVRAASSFGFGFGSRVMLLVDGVPQLDADDGSMRFDPIPAGMIRQVEVIRGPGSSLYGSGAVNGVVNVITLPVEEGMHGRIAAYGGLYDDVEQKRWRWWGGSTQGVRGIEGAWSGKSKSLSGTIGGAYDCDEGYRQFDDAERYNLFGRLGWMIEDAIDLRMTLFSSKCDRGGYRTWRSSDSALYALAPGGSLPRIVTSGTSINVELRRTVSEEFSYILRGVTRFSGVESNGAGSDSPGRQSSATSYLVETQFNSALTSRLTFMYGAVLGFDRIDSKIYGDHQKRTASLYAQMELNNGDDITASVQSRIDAIEEPGTGLQETHFSPRIGVTYRPAEESAFRIVLGRGFRTPSIAERYVNGSVGGVPMNPNPNLNSEQNWHGEAGLTQDMRSEDLQLSFDCALYVDEYFSLIEPLFNPSDGAVIFQNMTRARMLGADFQVQGIIPLLSLSFTGDISTVSARDLKLNRLLPSRPSMVGHLRLAWEERALSAALDYRYIPRIEAIDSVLRQFIPDAESGDATHSVDMQLALDLLPLLDIRASVRLQAHNIFQNYALDGIGSLAPIRNYELGVEVKL
jgi:iron complex outermembrane receptor protein